MTVRILVGDCRAVLATLPAESVHCVVTSPPYWGLRSYMADGDPLKPYELGLEPTPDLYVAHLVEVFRALRRVLRADGTCWVNLGDSYATGAGHVGEHPGGGEQGARWRGTGSKHDYGLGPIQQPNRLPIAGLKPKDLVGIPWRVAFALQADGWYLRSEIIWHKPNPMPESVQDRPTKAHEQLFLLAKSERYFYDAEAIKEPATYPDGMNGHNPVRSPYGQGFAAGRSDGSTTTGRNKRSVWTIPSAVQRGALRDVPSRLGRAVREGRDLRARRLPGLRGAVAAGGRPHGDGHRSV
jgi:DNA modification methylase